MMGLSTRKNRLIAALLATGLLLPATPALAQTGGTSYVAFGDSIAANPTWSEQLAQRENAPCRTGTDSYPENLAGNFPSFFNASCSGSTIIEVSGGGQISAEVLDKSIDRAEEHGALGANTTVVTLTIGANDAWPHALLYGYRADGTIEISSEEFAHRIRSKINRIKNLAPNARILLVGYPEFTEADNRLCLVNLDANGIPVQLPTQDATLRTYFQSLNTAMAQAAPTLGVEYVDIAKEFRGHNTCAPGNERWVTTVVDKPGVSLLPMHISSEGVKAQTRIINAHLNR